MDAGVIGAVVGCAVGVGDGIVSTYGSVKSAKGSHGVKTFACRVALHAYFPICRS